MCKCKQRPIKTEGNTRIRTFLPLQSQVTLHYPLLSVTLSVSFLLLIAPAQAAHIIHLNLMTTYPLTANTIVLCTVIMIATTVLCECFVAIIQVEPQSAEGLLEVAKGLLIFKLRAISLICYTVSLVLQALYMFLRIKNTLSNLCREKVFIACLITSMCIGVYFSFFVASFLSDDRMFLRWPLSS